jgi:adenine-specific DNA methylase
MIRNEKQYKISKRKLRELNEHIEKITIDTTQDPLRNRVILASLNNSKDEIANDIVVYEFLKKNKEGVLK